MERSLTVTVSCQQQVKDVSRFHIPANKMRYFFPFLHWNQHICFLWTMPKTHHQPVLVTDGQMKCWLWSYLVHQLTRQKLLWILESLLSALAFFGYSYSVFPRDLMSVLFPTTHVDGIDSELFRAFLGVYSQTELCRSLQCSLACMCCLCKPPGTHWSSPLQALGICSPPQPFLALQAAAQECTTGLHRCQNPNQEPCICSDGQRSFSLINKYINVGMPT